MILVSGMWSFVSADIALYRRLGWEGYLPVELHNVVGEVGPVGS